MLNPVEMAVPNETEVLKRLNEAVKKMGHLQLGKELTAEEVDLLLAFLNTLTDKTRQAKAE